MNCPKCGYNSCEIISESKVSGSDYSICQGICGEMLFGPLGSICGWTNNRETNIDTFWVCKKCGYKFKA